MHGHTATTVGSRLYIVGGRNGMEVYGGVHCFDTDTGVWSCVVRKGINMVPCSSEIQDVGGS
jgi:hypothetical protein